MADELRLKEKFRFSPKIKIIFKYMKIVLEIDKNRSQKIEK
jgi:hypothetical protein